MACSIRPAQQSADELTGGDRRRQFFNQRQRDAVVMNQPPQSPAVTETIGRPGHDRQVDVGRTALREQPQLATFISTLSVELNQAYSQSWIVPAPLVARCVSQSLPIIRERIAPDPFRGGAPRRSASSTPCAGRLRGFSWHETRIKPGSAVPGRPSAADRDRSESSSARVRLPAVRWSGKTFNLPRSSAGDVHNLQGPLCGPFSNNLSFEAMRILRSAQRTLRHQPRPSDNRSSEIASR